MSLSCATRSSDSAWEERVTFEIGVSDERLQQLYREALGVYFGPFDEDYGYVTIEGFAASRPVVTLTDSGGPLEFVRDDETGLVRPPEPKAIADAFDRLWNDRAGARAHGRRGPRPRARGGAPLAGHRRPPARLMRAGRAIARRLRRSTGAVEVQHGRGPGSEGDVVFAGPLPPAPTGIATYDRAVLDGLERIGFTDRLRMDVVWPVDTQDAGRFPGYHLGVFQLGNNVEFHLEIYRAAYLTSALVVLHDLALDDFVRGLKAAGEPLGYMAAREAARLRHELTDPDVLRNDPLREPWCAHVVRRARGVIVHSDFGRRYLDGFGCRTPVFVVPHPVIEAPDAFERLAPRARELRAGLGDPTFLVVAPGDMNEAKRLDALAQAAVGLGDGAHVAIVGRRIEGYDVEPVVEAARAGTQGQRACRRRGRRLPGLARRGRRGRRPALPASRRGERLAQPGDAGGQAHDRERHRHLPRRAGRRRAAGGAGSDRPRRARRGC